MTLPVTTAAGSAADPTDGGRGHVSIVVAEGNDDVTELS